MRFVMMAAILSAGLLLPSLSQAQAQAQAPLTATCKDGTAFSGTKRSGACRGHGGVKAWDAQPASTPAASASAASAPAAGTPATSAPAATASAPPAATRTPAGTPGPGQVWVNTASKVYHCPGDRWYGKTKAGQYMSETQAKSSGYHAEHNKACSAT